MIKNIIYYIILYGAVIFIIFKGKSNNNNDSNFNEIYDYKTINLLNYIDEKINDIKNSYLEDYLKKITNNEIKIDIKFIFSDVTFNKFNYYNMIFDEKEVGYLNSIYLDLDYFERRDVEERIFKGEILVDDIRLKIYFNLVKDERYNNFIDFLLEKIIMNNMKIDFIPTFLFDRMYRIKIIEVEDEYTLLDVYNFQDKSNITLNFEDLERKIYFERKILFNLEKVKLISDYYIKPNDENLLFKNVFKVENDEKYICIEENGLFEFSENIDHKLSIYSKKRNNKLWEFYNIKKVNNYFISSNLDLIYEFDILNVNYLNLIISNNKFFKDKIEILELSNDANNCIYFNKFKNTLNNKEIVILKIYSINDEYKYDRIYMLINILENIYSKYEFKVKL